MSPHNRDNFCAVEVYDTIDPGKEKSFDFQGYWCLEVVKGSIEDITVTGFKTHGASGYNNSLNMT